jgi:hypothetical protein
MCRPDGSGSEFFNYKSYFSTVLMALVDADYKFIAIEVGAHGSPSDSLTFLSSSIYTRG